MIWLFQAHSQIYFPSLNNNLSRSIGDWQFFRLFLLTKNRAGPNCRIYLFIYFGDQMMLLRTVQVLSCLGVANRQNHILNAECPPSIILTKESSPKVVWQPVESWHLWVKISFEQTEFKATHVFIFLISLALQKMGLWSDPASKNFENTKKVQQIFPKRTNVLWMLP